MANKQLLNPRIIQLGDKFIEFMQLRLTDKVTNISQIVDEKPGGFSEKIKQDKKIKVRSAA